MVGVSLKISKTVSAKCCCCKSKFIEQLKNWNFKKYRILGIYNIA